MLNIKSSFIKNNKIKNVHRSISFAFLLFLLTVFLYSCADLSSMLVSYLGFDDHDYTAEEVVTTHEADSEVARRLIDLTKLLTIDKPILKEFTSTREAAEFYGESILNYMLNNNYAKYNGNKKLLESAAKEYPNLHINTLITATDFENTVYKYFGGNESIKHQSNSMFQFLDKIKAFTTVGQPQNNPFTVYIVSLEETENTYRLTFFNQHNEITSPVYYMLVMKRADGSLYIKTITEVSDQRVIAPLADNFS